MNKSLLKSILFSVSILCQVNLFASESILGTWVTISDETGEATSHVEIFEATDNKLYGKVIKILDPKKKTEVCSLCSDYRKDQAIEGMVIIDGLNLEDGKYQNGEILDPKKGKFYDCQIWREGNELKVRGYIGFFFRTQTWQRLKD